MRKSNFMEQVLSELISLELFDGPSDKLHSAPKNRV